MKIRKLRNQERGVSVILGAILLMGILILTFPIIYHQHVKSNMIDNEEAQMENVKEQFLELQSKISYMEGPNDNGQTKIPMSAESVPLFPGQSPAGTITTIKGNGIPTDIGGDPNTKVYKINTGSIKFQGRNLFYPDQNYILEAGHVILEQDGKSIMISPNEDLITYSNNSNENKLEIKYPYLNKTKSISSTSTETITLKWGGRKRYPQNKELIKTDQTLKFTFITDHIKAWETYLQAKDDNITNIDFEVNKTADRVYIQTPDDANFTYYASSTELGGEVKEPIVETKGFDEEKVNYNSAVLNMSYNFKDYSEGEIRFQYREIPNGTWGSSGWETQYGTNSTYSRLISGLKPDTEYIYRAQIKYNSKTKKGEIKGPFETETIPEYGIGNETGNGTADTIIMPTRQDVVYLQDSNWDEPTLKLTLNNTYESSVNITKSRVAFYSLASPGGDSIESKWGSNITNSSGTDLQHKIGGDFQPTENDGEILPDENTKIEIYLDADNNNYNAWIMYQFKIDPGGYYSLFVSFTDK